MGIICDPHFPPLKAIRPSRPGPSTPESEVRRSQKRTHGILKCSGPKRDTSLDSTESVDPTNKNKEKLRPWTRTGRTPTPGNPAP